MEGQRITVFDTTLRDGEQSPGCSMNVHEKVRLGRQLDRLGVDVIEAGFPIASDGDFAAVCDQNLRKHGLGIYKGRAGPAERCARA